MTERTPCTHPVQRIAAEGVSCIDCGAAIPQRIGPMPGMPALRPVVPVSRAFSSQAGMQSLRAGTPLSGAHAAAESPYAAEKQSEV